jgi:ATP-dependent protease ClpP protease subunit
MFLADVSLNFDSRGGFACEGVALFRAIRYRVGRTSAHVRAGAVCCSAALDIYLGADIRTAHADAAFLFHRSGLAIEKGTRWTAENLPAALAQMKKIDEWMFHTAARRTDAKLQNLIAEAATERHMTATAAWHLGIVNRQPLWWLRG